LNQLFTGDVSVQDADLFETWKSNRGALGPISTRSSGIDNEALKKRRMENLSWRMLNMETLGSVSPALAPSKYLNGDLDIPSFNLLGGSASREEGDLSADNIAQVAHMLGRYVRCQMPFFVL
jgi:hypothetical protein